MFKPRVEDLSGAKLTAKGSNTYDGKPIEIKLFDGKVLVVDSYGNQSKAIEARDLIMASETLKAAFKNLAAVCVEHGHFGAAKGKKQTATCPGCLTNIAAKIVQEGSEDNDG